MTVELAMGSMTYVAAEYLEETEVVRRKEEIEVEWEVRIYLVEYSVHGERSDLLNGCNSSGIQLWHEPVSQFAQVWVKGGTILHHRRWLRCGTPALNEC